MAFGVGASPWQHEEARDLFGGEVRLPLHFEAQHEGCSASWPRARLISDRSHVAHDICFSQV